MKQIDSTEDRRTQRSDDPLVALYYQLNERRTEANLDALVIANADGFVVAGAGGWAACEELAAYAPLLASGADLLDDACVDVRPFDIDGERVFLCARGKLRSFVHDAAIDAAIEGSRRILSRIAA